MKALVYTGTREMEFRELPEPSAEIADTLVAVRAAGICGSDMHAYHGHDPRRVPPMVLGHEAAGEVLDGPSAGTTVVINPLVSCGACEYCTTGRSNLCPTRKMVGMNYPGAFAERLRVPARNLIAVPPGMDTVAAALTEPAATALHGIHLAERAGQAVAEGRTLVLGGGSVGLLAASLLAWRGCRDIVLSETNRLRRRTACALGVCEVHDPSGEAALPGDGFHLVIDAVGCAATRDAAIAAVRPGGIIVHIGLQEAGGAFDFRKLTLSEISVLGAYTYTPQTLQAALDALHAGAGGSLAWVERRPLSEGLLAFGDLDQGRSAAAKIVLLPD